MLPLELDLTAITAVITDLGNGAKTLVPAALAVSVALFAIPFMWKKAKKLLGS